MVHAATVEDGALVGMGAMLLDGSTVSAQIDVQGHAVDVACVCLGAVQCFCTGLYDPPCLPWCVRKTLDRQVSRLAIPGLAWLIRKPLGSLM